MIIKGLKLDVTVNASFKVNNFEAPDRKVEGFKMKDTGASVNFELEEVSLQSDEMKGLTEMISGVVRDQLHFEMEKEMRKAEEIKRYNHKKCNC